MKKYILFIFVSTALLHSVKGQNAVTQAPYHTDIVKTIVKEFDYPATISYVETKTEHYFAFADQSMTVTNCEIDADIFVRDFVVIDNKVYFCGFRDGKSTSGIWGMFDILGLQNANLSYEVYEHFACNYDLVDTLHRLVVYNDNANILHIVTIGTTSDGYSTNGCIIDITPNTSGGTAWTYNIGVTPTYSGERINRICVTDNLIVTSGPAAMHSNLDVYRVYNKNNLFMPGGPQDEIWHFPLSSLHQYDHNPENYEITHINNDIVAMAIQIQDISYYYPLQAHYGILVMAYDMSALSNGSISTLYSHYASTLTYKLNVESLRYTRTNDELLLLLNGNIPIPFNGTHSIVAEIPLLTTTATTSILTNQNLTSLDNYNSQQSSVCHGFDNIQPNKATYYTQPINTSPVCATTYNPLISAPDFITKWDPMPLTLCQEKFDCTKLQQLNVLNIPNEIICSDF